MLTSTLFFEVHQSLLFGNEAKLVALLVYTSFVRIATSGFWITPYSLIVAVVCAQMRSATGITPYSPQPQHNKLGVVLVTSLD